MLYSFFIVFFKLKGLKMFFQESIKNTWQFASYFKWG